MVHVPVYTNNKNPTTNGWEWWIGTRMEQPIVYNKENEEMNAIFGLYENYKIFGRLEWKRKAFGHSIHN